MSEKIALIAGNGNLPYYFYNEALKSGYEVFPIGVVETVSDKLKKIDNYVEIHIGELGKLISYLIINKIDKIIMLGKVEKKIVFSVPKLDDHFQSLVDKLPDRKDETLLYGIINLLKENNLEVLPQNFLLDKLICEEKQYTDVGPDKIDKDTIKIGIEASQALGRIDVGQTVVAKNRAIVALEAVEGSDETIKRAGKYANKECIIVKTARPQQDMRMDVPAIGLETIKNGVAINAKGIVIQAGKMIFLDQEEAIKLAEENNMFIVGVSI